jgi:hypothetical protein
MVDSFFSVAVCSAAEEDVVVTRWPASNLALEVVLLVGLAGAGCWEGATVTSVTADCLHGTDVGFGKEDRKWGATRLAGKSRNNDR